MPRWTGPGRFTARGDLALSRSRLADLQSKARKVVGDLENRVRLGQIGYGRRTVEVAEGVFVEAIVSSIFPSVPMVQARLVIQQQSVPEDTRQVSVFELYALRYATVPDNNIDINDTVSISKFTYSQGLLRHDWELVFSTGDFHSASLGRSFVVDVRNSKMLLFGRSAMFNPRVEGVFNCFTSAARYPVTFLEAQTLVQAPTFAELGVDIVPRGEFHGGSSGCSGIFSLGSEFSPTPIADFGYRWEGNSDGAVLAVHPEAGYVICDNQSAVEGGDVDPDSQVLSFYRITNTRTKMLDVDIGTPISIPSALAQDPRTLKIYVLVTSPFGGIGLKLLVFDPATITYELQTVSNLIEATSAQDVYVSKSGNRLFVSSVARNLGTITRINRVLQIDLDTTTTSEVINAGEPTFDGFGNGISVFGGISAVDNGNTLIIGNAGESSDRTTIAWIYRKRDGVYELDEEIPLPGVGVTHPAAASMATDRAFAAIQTIRVQ